MPRHSAMLHSLMPKVVLILGLGFSSVTSAQKVNAPAGPARGSAAIVTPDPARAAQVPAAEGNAQRVRPYGPFGDAARPIDDATLSTLLPRPQIPKPGNAPALPVLPKPQPRPMAPDELAALERNLTKAPRASAMKCELLPTVAQAVCEDEKRTLSACSAATDEDLPRCLGQSTPLRVGADCNTLPTPNAREACSAQASMELACRGKLAQDLAACIKLHFDRGGGPPVAVRQGEALRTRLPAPVPPAPAPRAAFPAVSAQ